MDVPIEKCRVRRMPVTVSAAAKPPA